MIVGRWQVDLNSRRVTRAGARMESAGTAETLRLTPTEWAVLELLLKRPGQLVSSAQLLARVWRPGFQQRTNYLRFQVAQLRRKLEDDPPGPATCSPSPAWATAISPRTRPARDQKEISRPIGEYGALSASAAALYRDRRHGDPLPRRHRWRDTTVIYE
jgi:hypothetical protein